VEPIGHRQERGDYQESWMPCPMKPAVKRSAQRMAKAVVERLAGPDGAGIFGVEFFVKGDRVIFSELSPRPHDTGMVTLRSQDLSEFDLHVRAILGLPIPAIRYNGPTASAVVLATRDSERAPTYSGIDKAMAIPSVEVRIFGKPTTRKHRRMGVVLAHGATAMAARKPAMKAADAPAQPTRRSTRVTLDQSVPPAKTQARTTRHSGSAVSVAELTCSALERTQATPGMAQIIVEHLLGDDAPASLKGDTIESILERVTEVPYKPVLHQLADDVSPEASGTQIEYVTEAGTKAIKDQPKGYAQVMDISEYRHAP
jgi:hypothetical protein